MRRISRRIHSESSNITSEATIASYEMDKERHETIERLLIARPPPEALLPCYQIPYPENPRFVGRRIELESIANALLPVARNSLRSFAMHGLGGLGKSEIALQFAYTHMSQYRAIFWATAETVEKVNAAFVDIAKSLNIWAANMENDQTSCRAEVLRWLNTAGMLLVSYNFRST